jgi:hypothetical protein
MIFSYEYNNVMNMKRFLLGFLMITMLTPMLVCGTGAGVKHAKAAAPCHNEHPGKSKARNSNGVMFMLDCMQVDLFGADGVSIQKPDQSFEYVSYHPARLATAYQFLAIRQKARAPPPGYLPTVDSSPSIIITTGRFRI